jgi:hypothetical protein
MNRLHRLLVIMAVALALAAGSISPAQAAAPSNDGPGGATAATGIGFTDSVNVSQATSGSSDPTDCANNASVWYRYRATTTQTINVNTMGSNYDTVLGVYTGRLGALTRVACRNWSRFNRQAALDLRVEEGKTYHFMVGVCCGTGRDGRDFSQQPLLLQFSMTAPLAIDRVAIPGDGRVSPTNAGSATLPLSIRCNHAAGGNWSGVLRQRVSEIFVARGFAFRRTACGTTPTETSLTFQPEGDVAFVEGPAIVSLRLSACSRDTGTCTVRRLTREVVLANPQP